MPPPWKHDSRNDLRQSDSGAVKITLSEETFQIVREKLGELVLRIRPSKSGGSIASFDREAKRLFQAYGIQAEEWSRFLAEREIVRQSTRSGKSSASKSSKLSQSSILRSPDPAGFEFVGRAIPTKRMRPENNFLGSVGVVY